jgi:hypothetical protein
MIQEVNDLNECNAIDENNKPNEINVFVVQLPDYQVT